MRPSPSGSSGFFSSRELLRLSSAIFLLGIVGLIYVQSRNTYSRQRIAREQEAPPIAAALKSESEDWKERVVPHPGHTDPEEIDALREEMQAIGDQSPLAAEEMPAYWRMVKWAYAIPGEELRKLARKDLLFTHLFQKPDKYRGQLIDVKLRVMRVLKHEAPQNSANVQEVFEAWGPSAESQTFPYCVVFVDVPPGLPVSANVDINARFVGFFHKKMSYQDAAGKWRTAPLLIGRMLSDKTLMEQAPVRPKHRLQWIVGIVTTLIVGILAIQWWSRLGPITPRTPLVDEEKVDSFLDHLESGLPTTPDATPSVLEPPD